MSTFIFYWRRPTPPLFVGGAEITQNILAKQLAKNHKVIYVGSVEDPNYPSEKLKQYYLKELQKDNDVENFKQINNDSYIYNYLNIECILLSQYGLDNAIELFLKDKNNCNNAYFITGMESANNFVNIANLNNIKTIVWLHSTNKNEIESIKYNPTLILSTSEYVRNFLLNNFKVDSYVFYPLFEDSIQTVLKNNKKFITFINPVEEKGSELFLDIVNILSNTSFLAVEGWYKNIKFLQNIPSNVKYLERQKDMGKIWQQTKLLLVPSKIDEAFGRVIVEASHNYIPVIASNKGGICEALNNSGCLLDYNNIDLWIRNIKKYTINKTFYENESLKAFNSTKIFYNNNTEHFLKLLD